MTTTIQFIDHGRFHRTAYRVAVAGGLSALAAHVVTLLAPRLGGLAGPLPLAAVAGAAVFCAIPEDEARRARPDLSLVILAAAVAAAALVAVGRGDLGPVVGAGMFAGALGLALARGLSGRRLWGVAAVGSLAILGAPPVVAALAAHVPGPSWLGAIAAGLGAGAVVVLGSLPRHLEVVHSATPAALGRGTAASGKRGSAELRELTARARAAGGQDCLRPLAEQLEELDRRAATLPAREVLADRSADLARRAEATSDELARTEYQRAQVAVDQQLGEFDVIAAGRERVLARIHRELADMERQKSSAVFDRRGCGVAGPDRVGSVVRHQKSRRRPA